MEAYNVYLNGEKIDTVFYSTGSHANDTKAEAEADVKRSLVNHDGYSSGIVVKRERKRREVAR